MTISNATYGPRPRSFTMDDSGERYYIGSEVGAYLRLYRGTLYKKYPVLWRKVATVEDKEKLRQTARSQAFMHTNIIVFNKRLLRLVKAHEIDELLSGQEEKCRAATTTPAIPRVESGIAEIMCEDLDLPTSIFQPAIASAIYQKKLRLRSLPLDPNITDQRAIMKLNINVGNQSLVDQFEWDMSNPDNSPEQFARNLCAELGLGGKLTSAIAYSIRGQLQWNQKTYAFAESPQPTLECSFR
ncbi:SNF5 / SMARCB1 / INI1 protein [Dictyocaulus viviparus]|uniref:SNF5 / SMARCB1 / INI1 protein n=1 Tax=Dictyocaulus viviparus TaxID=29172 RepID=A0A0D8X6R3_DICVI|nr:SNF5 / SMARCB1 / INI1 protein [Dictyocaulus viviparus]